VSLTNCVQWQVFSAICVIFAHGAGEVGYMAGPLAAIWDVYNKGVLAKSVSPPVWVILIGACGLVVGLGTYGYNVTRAMGVELAKLTPRADSRRSWRRRW